MKLSKERICLQAKYLTHIEISSTLVQRMSNCAHFKQSATTQEGNDPNIKTFLSEDPQEDETSEILKEIYRSSKNMVKVGHKLHVFCCKAGLWSTHKIFFLNMHLFIQACNNIFITVLKLWF